MIARGYDCNTVTEIDSSTVGRNGEKHKSMRVIANNYVCNTMPNADSYTVSRNGQKHVTESGSKHLGEMDT